MKKRWFRLKKKYSPKDHKPIFVGIAVILFLLTAWYFFPPETKFPSSTTFTNAYDVKRDNLGNDNGNGNTNNNTSSNSSYQREIGQKRLNSAYYQNVPSEQKGSSVEQHYSSSYNNNQYLEK